MDKVCKQAAVGTLSKKDLEKAMPPGILPYGWKRMAWNKIVGVIENLSTEDKNVVASIVREKKQDKREKQRQCCKRWRQQNTASRRE